MERSDEEIIKSITKVVKEDDGNEYTYVGSVCVACNGEETIAGKVIRLADEQDIDFDCDDGPSIYYYPDLLRDEDHNKQPLKNRTPRFQLFTVNFHFNKHKRYKPYFMSGYITIFNRFVKAKDDDYDYDDDYDHDLSLSPPSYGSVLFYRSLHDPVRLLNMRLLEPLTHPTHYSIPVYDTFLDIVVDLYAISRDPDDDKVFFQIKNDPKDFKLPVPKYDIFCTHKINGHDGYIDLAYIILTDPVDATFEITFHPDYDITGKLFDVNLTAFYADYYGLGLKSNPTGFFYSLVLLQKDSYPLLNKGKITLNRSLLAVPANGTLVIRADIHEIEEDIMYFTDDFRLPVKYNGTTNVREEGESCSLEVNVNWKYVTQHDEDQPDIQMQTKIEAGDDVVRDALDAVLDSTSRKRKQVCEDEINVEEVFS